MRESSFNYRSRIATPSAYERALADTLFEILGRGRHDLDSIVAALRASAVKPPDGADWTIESFRAEIARLGAGPGAGPASAVRV